MPDETYYKVTLQVELTIRSDSPEWAIDAAVAAVADAAGGAVHAVTTDRGETSAEKIAMHEFPAEDFEANGIHVLTPDEILSHMQNTDPRHFDHEV
jgi:hypothetical protein